MLPQKVEHWSLTTLRDKLIKIGAKMVRHGRYVAFQMAEVAVLRRMLGQILARIAHACAAGADLTRATVGVETKIAGDVCLDDEKHGHCPNPAGRPNALINPSS